MNKNWDLTDIYPAPNSKEVEKDLETVKQKATDFENNYKGKLKELSADAFAKMIEKYENISLISHKLGGYAYLNMSTQFTNNDAVSFYQNISEKLNDYSKPLIFFTLEINSLSEEQIQNVTEYKSWLKRVRILKPYQLSPEIEEILHEKSVTSSDAFVRLYDEFSAGLKYNIDGKEYNDAEISKLMLDKDEVLRKKAGIELNNVTGKHAALFALVTNTLAKDKQIEDIKRGFKSPIQARNISNQVEDTDVEALVAAVKNNYANISHRYYKLKAKWMGKEKLEYWDRNAPLPFSPDREFSWDETVKIVLDAYKKFSPKVYEIAKPFFDNNWIDILPKDGKRSGAYAMGMPADIHPYLFLNFTGKQRDVLTLAHELGHGVHQSLAKAQGELQQSTPLTLAETASVFGEMITFLSMLEMETDPKAKIAMLASKVEDMINTAIRQISFHLFEDRVHKARYEGEISIDTLCSFWSEEMKSSLGEGVNIDENSKYIWAQIPHFIHSPYYVYAYSFADCLVNSLYMVYKEGKISDFQDKYIELLKAGGTKSYRELLSTFGIDASKPDFWNKGLSVISGFIDQLEELSTALD